MSWNGTVHCSYCYREGHNNRTCPKHKEEAEQLIAEGNEENWTVRTYKNKKQKVKRQCSFCQAYVDLYNDDDKMEESYNHNKRTCELKKNAVATLHKENISHRKKVVKYFNKMGIAPGALVRCERYGSEQVYFITEIQWHRIFLVDDGTTGYRLGNRGGRELMCAPLDNLGYGAYAFDIPLHEKYYNNEKGYYKTTLISPLKNKVTPPKGWLKDIECVKACFST
tara:strand:- start:75 stop:746 length:672 start_codon:yes stop_codon:yes gene_type:complete